MFLDKPLGRVVIDRAKCLEGEKEMNLNLEFLELLIAAFVIVLGAINIVGGSVLISLSILAQIIRVMKEEEVLAQLIGIVTLVIGIVTLAGGIVILAIGMLEVVLGFFLIF